MQEGIRPKGLTPAQQQTIETLHQRAAAGEQAAFNDLGGIASGGWPEAQRLFDPLDAQVASGELKLVPPAQIVRAASRDAKASRRAERKKGGVQLQDWTPTDQAALKSGGLPQNPPLHHDI